VHIAEENLLPNTRDAKQSRSYANRPSTINGAS
jgi:hypothetical protein